MASLDIALPSLDQIRIMALPRYIVLKSIYNNKYLSYVTEEGETHGYLQFSGEEILSPFVKFEVELADGENGFVNLRCCYNNKYWVRNSKRYIAGAVDQPNEDLSSSSCTLFTPISVDQAANTVRIMHTQSQCYTCLWRTAKPYANCVYAAYQVPDHASCDIYTIIDWESLVIMPKFVTFKGYNGEYLKVSYIKGYPYLQLSSDDKGDPACAYEIFPTDDGNIRIKSKYLDRFWRRDPNWIKADSTDTTTSNANTVFGPVKVDNNTIALRNLANNNFCRSLTLDGKTDCLNASISTISKYAQLQVEELVFSRDIYNIRFRLNDARIYNERVFVAATNAGENRTNNNDTMSLKLAYTDSKSSTWNASLSLKVGVKTTIQTGVPFIVKGQVEVTIEFEGGYEWGETKTETTQIETSYQATVPPKSKVVVNLVATKGSCDVPFSYTQRDTLYDGSHVITEMDDGIYTGVNYYNFNYVTELEDL